MIHRFALAAALFAIGGLMPTYSLASLVALTQRAVVAQALPPLFSTESAAQANCPHDTVVWLNIRCAGGSARMECIRVNGSPFVAITPITPRMTRKP
jgi:hypothetical protein